MNSSLTYLNLRGGVIYDDCIDMEIDDDLMIFMRWIMEPDWRGREEGSEGREEKQNTNRH